MMISSGCGNIDLLNEQMTEHPFFSVIITAYNIENYIRDCIKSVQKQTFTELECIIVDDGSSDGTCKAVRQSIGNDARFRLLTVAHGGPQRAKNAGLEAARGEYLIFADGDDTLSSDCLRDCREKAGGNDLLIFGINYQSFADGELVSEKPVSLPPMEFSSGAELADWYIKHQRLLLYSNANKLYRREALLDSGIRFRDGLSFGEDRVFNFDFLRACKRIAVLPGVYYNYRAINPVSLTRGYKHHHIDTLLLLHEQKTDCICSLAEKTSQREKESYRKDDYKSCFDSAFELLKSGRDGMTEEEYAEEQCYLESRYVPQAMEPPFRFILEHAWMSRKKRVSVFMEQIRAFKGSDAMQTLVAVLDRAAQRTGDIKRRCDCGDDYSFLCQFKTRRGERFETPGSPEKLIIEDLLLDEKEQIYSAMFGLGLIGNNKTSFDSYDFILILGGANDSNRSRTIKARELADELCGKGKTPKLIAGVSTNRRLDGSEHMVTDLYAKGMEYEFDVLSKCLENELFTAGAEKSVLSEHTGADPTLSSKIIEFSKKYKGCTVRSYCAPKRDPGVQRADTEDCLEFFMDSCDVPEGSSVLLVTNNIYCGSCFKPGVGIEHGINLDIVGNWPDTELITAERMSCSLHLNELIKTLAELNRFEEKYR